MYNIGEKIAKLRKGKNMTQEELADIIGVSSQSISKWENNVTMPDILLLPVIASFFEITLDELFSIERRSRTFTAIEETPFAVYDAILDTMWAWDETNPSIDHIKNNLSNSSELHTGFVSIKCGGVYADKNIALTYIADNVTSAKLFSNENVAVFLQCLANPNVRKILKYQLENGGASYTVSSVSLKCGIKEEDAKQALESMINYSLSRKQTVEMDTGERIDIYSHFGDHKLPMLIYPILSLAEKLSDFKESWCGLRA